MCSTMRLHTSWGAVWAVLQFLLVSIPSQLSASTPIQIWGQGGASTQLSQADARQLPAELSPAFGFQLLYEKILAGAKPSEWRSEMAELASTKSTDPVSLATRDVARVWLARVETQDIDLLLLEYYRHNVRFPKTDAEFQKLLPSSLSKDPWGQPWVYSAQTPRGFSSVMNGQRYQVSPSGVPGLLSLEDSLKNRKVLELGFTVTARELGGHQVLEFRSPQMLAVIGPGGKAGSFTLMYIGDHWALLSADDRIFAISF